MTTSIGLQPKVFVSHASEDKLRFVVPFAEGLRSSGIDAWLDAWEMLPGDSLVTKVFDEGLDGATAVVVVLSRISITKPWVSEELNVAVVKRINTGSRLIPVVLDDLSVEELPAAVRHLLHVRASIEAIDEAAENVCRAVWGELNRPPLGQPPKVATERSISIAGIDHIDSLVLRELGEIAVDIGRTRVNASTLTERVDQRLSLSAATMEESTEVLAGLQLVTIDRTLSAVIAYTLTWLGLETYLRAYASGYESRRVLLLSQVANAQGRRGSAAGIAKSCDAPILEVEHLLTWCESHRMLILSRGFGGSDFLEVSPLLKRQLA